MKKIKYTVDWFIGDYESTSTFTWKNDAELSVISDRDSFIEEVKQAYSNKQGNYGLTYEVRERYGFPFDDAFIDWFHNVIEESYRRIGAIGGFFA